MPTVIAGVNSANVLPVDKPVGITRGSASVNYADPDQPTARAHEWSLLVEREIMSNTVVKTGFVGTHGSRLAQYYSYNNNAPAYVWYTQEGVPFPTGEFANVARRPFDQTVYGTVQAFQKTGWSNNTSFQVEVEHRYSKGYAFQIFYVMSNAMRVPAMAGGMTRCRESMSTYPARYPRTLTPEIAFCSTAGIPPFPSIA